MMIRYPLIVALLGVIGFAADARAIEIARNGDAQAVIVVAPDASAPQKHAADELASILKQVTGGTFTIVNQPQDSTPAIYVGEGAAKLADPTFTTDGLGTDGIVVRTVGDSLILAGGETRGTLYAVYSFLEEEVGCRWWTPTVSTIPGKPDLSFDTIDRTYVPQLEHREIVIASISMDGNWSVRNKLVGELHGYGTFDQQHLRGGARKAWPTGHSYYIVLPPDKYFAKHPEWYSLINGKRDASPLYSNLCLTNEAMQEQFIANLKEIVRNAPAEFSKAGGQYPGYFANTDNGLMFVGVSAEDDNMYPVKCECDKCLAAEKADGGATGMSIRLANRASEEIRREFPGKSVLTFAYHHTQKPSATVAPDPEVVVYYCPIHASFAKPMTDPRNTRWREDFEGWAKIASRLYFYDYPNNVSYPLIPHPNLDVVVANIKYAASLGATGYFGDGIMHASGAGGTELAELRAWVIAKLLWNPSLDGKALIEEFCAGYYGAAAPEFLAYLDVIHTAKEQYGDWLGLSSEVTAHFLSTETLSEAWKHLKAAEKAVEGDRELTRRIKIAQLPVMVVYLSRWDLLKNDARDRGIDWPFTAARPIVYNDFLKFTKGNNIVPGAAIEQIIAKGAQ